MLCMIAFIIILNIMFGFVQSSNVDNYGHIGGIIVGLSMSFFILNPISKSPYETKIKYAGIVVFTLYFLIGFIVFYTATNPQPFYGV